jgi:hypothetical protein
MAIHESPKAKVSGSRVWFRVARGIRQGCVLGPTLFIILLEFAKRQAGLHELGIKFNCAGGKHIGLPPDLSRVSFQVGSGEYADDMVLIDTCATRLTKALNRLQTVCGKIGLDISVSKTEWLYLHNPNANELGECRSKRTPTAHCCEQISLDGKSLKHVSSFKYLGSTLSENGGMEDETRYRVLQSELCLNRYSSIWKSDLSLRQKVRFLKSHIFPILLYASESGNHTQKELDQIEVLLNKCRRRILQIGRRTTDGEVITNEELHRRCRLPTALELLSRRRLQFATRIITKPGCETARRMLFAEIAQRGRRKVGGRERSSYLNVINLDLKYLNSGSTSVGSLENLVSLARTSNPPKLKRVLNGLKPDLAKGSKLKLVNERPKPFECEISGCRAKFAERKEVNRHMKRSHLNAVSGSVPLAAGTQTKTHACPMEGCTRVFKTPGWLDRHIKSNHEGIAVPSTRITPPPPDGIGSEARPTRNGRSRGLRAEPLDLRTSVGTVVGRGPGSSATSSGTDPTEVPVSSSGDGGVGLQESRLRRSRRLAGGNSHVGL